MRTIHRKLSFKICYHGQTHHYDFEAKIQNGHTTTYSHQKIQDSTIVMLSEFWDSQGVTLADFLQKNNAAISWL